MIHKVKAFGRVNEAEVEVFLELSCFFYNPTDVGNLINIKRLNLVAEGKNMYLILLMIWVINQEKTQFGSLSVGSFRAAIRCHLELKSFKDLTELWFCKEINSQNRSKDKGTSCLQLNSERIYIFRKKWGRRGTEKEGHTHTHTQIKASY